MLKSDKNYTVTREYQCRFGMEELVRRIIRDHIRAACEKEEVSGREDHGGYGHAK